MIYLDNAATTQPFGGAMAQAGEFVQKCYFNPSAQYGGEASAALKEARASILEKIADPAQCELIFTSGGTEADNHALLACGRRNVVISAGEHAAVYEAGVHLKNAGVELRFAPVGQDGGVREEALLSLVDERTSLVSVVHVNNETGAVNDIFGLARRVKEKNPRCAFHSDGVQAFGKLPVRLNGDIDLYSVSAHKIGGLRGTGALIKRKGFPLQPLLHGGGQEGGLRSGTENLFGIMDFAFAAAEKFKNAEADLARMRELRERLWQLLDQDLYVRLSPADGSPYILTVSARGLRGEILQRLCAERGVIVGTGSACSSKKPHSRVLEACGYKGDVLDGVLRMSFSPATNEEEIVLAAQALNAAAAALKARIG